MRKSFTRLSSILVLLFLSVQMVFAQPILDKANPVDGGPAVAKSTSQFTLTFKGDIVPGTGGAISLYKEGSAIKTFQVNGPNTVAANGKATFTNNAVTIEFIGVTFTENSTYWIDIENKAIKDANGNQFNAAAAFASIMPGNNVSNFWDFKISDTAAPTLAATNPLDPKDDAKNVPLNQTFTVNFSEQVKFVNGYMPHMYDFALYTSTDMAPGQNQEGGDLLSLNGHTAVLDPSGMFATITWTGLTTLPPYTEMYIRIKPGILEDMSGNKFAGINNNTAWNFTTKDVTTFDPVITADHASGALWTNDNFYITFTEAIYLIDGTPITPTNVAAKLASEISLVDNEGNNVLVTLTLTGNVIKLDPTAAKLTSSKYTVNMNGAVVRYAAGTVNKAATKSFTSGDWAAPVIEQFITTNYRGTSFDIFAKANENCTIKYIVVKKGAGAAQVADIIGYTATGANVTGTTRVHRVAPLTSPEGNLNKGYTIGTGTTAVTYEIFAEGFITVTNPLEVQHRVDNLPATQGPANGEGEYMVYYVAYDASTTGVYDPDYSNSAPQPAILGNMTGVAQKEAHTVDILMPTVWFDGDSTTHGKLLNSDKKNPVALGANLATLHKKGAIYLNFNEGIRLLNGAPITDSSIPTFITLSQGGGSVHYPIGFTASYSAATKQITIVADSSFKSGTEVIVSIVHGKIEDLAGNEYQPLDLLLSTQVYNVEFYNPVLAHFNPADAKVDFRENCIVVQFNDIIYAPAETELVQGQMIRLNNDPVSIFYVGKYFDVNQGNQTAAFRTDPTIKDDFDFTISYDDTKSITTVNICRNNNDWLSENWYYVEAETRLLDSNRSLLGDGAGITSTSTPLPRTTVAPFVDITTEANNNVSVSFKYGDVRAPELMFYLPRLTINAAYPLHPIFTDIDQRHDVLTGDQIGVYIDEYVMLGFADEIDFRNPAPGDLETPVSGNAFRRYFSLESEGQAIDFDIIVSYIDSLSGLMYLVIDPYYPADGGFEEDINFKAGIKYTVKYISTQLEGDLGEAYQDKAKNKVFDEVVANFWGEAAPIVPTVAAVYTPAHGAVVPSSTSEIVITFDKAANGASITSVPTIDLTDATTSTTQTLSGVWSIDYKKVTYAITTPLIETEVYNVTVAANAFGFNLDAATWPTPVGTDSTWTFSTVDGTAPLAMWFFPADDAINVPLTTDLIIFFNEEIFPVTGNKLYLWDTGTSEKFSIDASNCTKVGKDSILVENSKFASFLKYNTSYHVVLQPAFVKDAAGNNFAGVSDFTVWNFTTGTEPAVAFKAFSPKDATLNVQPLVVSLSRAATAQPSTSYKIFNLTTSAQVDTWNVTDGMTSTNNKDWTITGFTPVYGNEYTVEIDAGAFKDSNGALTPAMAYGVSAQATDVTTPVWVINFNDIAAPTAKFWPADNEVSIPYNAHLYVQFNEKVALQNGPIISVDPTLLATNIASFFTLSKGTGPITVPFNIEFVDASKRTVRITPLDPQGHNYGGTSNPTMQPETLYNLTIVGNNGTYNLVDLAGNVFAGANIDFTTEDITAPVITNLAVSGETANSAIVDFDIDEVATAWVYVVQGTPSAAPSVATIKANAQWKAKPVVVGNNSTGKITVEETVGVNTFTVYVVAQDDETDPYANPDPTMWIFTSTGDNINSIRDVLPAPNVSAVLNTTFNVCDDDAPLFVSSDPVHGAIGVPTDQEIVIKFNELVQSGSTVNFKAITLRKSKNNAAVAVSFIFGADSTLVITPEEDLEEQTTYYVEIDRYAITDGPGCFDVENFFNEWVGKNNLQFQTIDMTAPVVNGYYPHDTATCISLDLPYARVYLTETNALKKFSAIDETVKIYHNGVIAHTIDFSSNLVTFGNDATKGKYLQIDLSGFIILSDVEVTISIPANLIGDEFGNKLITPINWSFFTIDNVPPVVSWTLYDWNTYFNNSASTEVGIAKYNAEYANGNAGETVTNAPTHSVLKIEFDEDIEMLAGTKWLPLSAFNANTASNVPNAATDAILSRAELFANLKVGNLTYNDDSTKSELYVYEVGDNYVVIGYKKTISQLLVEAVEDGSSDLGVASAYFGSLLSETSYAVTIKTGSISDPLTCTDQRIKNVSEAVVTLNTRDDNPPTLEFSTCVDNCVAADGVITLTFDKPVVKSSYDISWIEIQHESHTFDNLPLSVLDISATNAGKYIEFSLLDPVDSSFVSTVEVKNITFDGLTGISFAPKTKLVSEGLYQIKFNKWTVKEFIENDPTGALFEGDSCIFQVFDYLAPEVAVSGFSPANGATAISSNVNSISILFNEKIQKGSGTVKIRRENGQIYEEVNIANCTITPATGNTSKRLLTIPFGTHTGLEDFTLYYVEMPEGFVTDTAVCAHNPFKGLGVKLAAGNFLSADWSFTTSDATPPQLLANANGELIGLNPVPGSENVAKNANLVMTFDENIVMTSNANAGIVIYFNNGDAPIPAPGQAGDFGNAVEFIPWGSPLISISGSNIYNQLDKNVVTVNPNTVFDRLGTYYVRATGNNVKDIAGNMWSQSTNVLLDEIKDYEWYFTITNDVAPVLVQTDPDYDGVAAPLVYVELTSEDVNKGTVIADLKMWFEDGAGNPVNVMAGAEDALLYIYEYVYNPVLQNYESREWTNYNMYDEDVVFSGNTITIKDVVLRSGINGDSVYYVTVDPGAVLNGFEGSQTWWPGISNGLRWRFQTAYDTEFIAGYEILSPYGEEAVDLEIVGVADLLQVKFNENIQALVAPGAYLKVYEYNEDVLVETVTIDETMIDGDQLNVTLALLEDETTYYVVIEEGAFADASTSFNPSFEVGGKDEWFFNTGDNTAPTPVVNKGEEILTDGATCVGAGIDFVLDYNESAGVFAQPGGTITLTDALGELVEEIAIDDSMIEFDILSFSLAAALEDFTSYILTFSEGMVVDGDTHSPLASPEVVINFTTGDVTLPTAVVISPLVSELADTVIVIEFSEIVNAVNAVASLRVQGETVSTSINLVKVDSVTYTAAVTELKSEATYEVVIAAGAFEDFNEECSVNTNDELVLTFQVADLEVPVATYAPKSTDDYKNLKLWIVFDEEVTNTEIGDVVVYNAAADTVVLTIPVADFLSEDNMSFSYTTSDLYYGEFYLLVDAGTFVDETAAPSGVVYAGVADETVWPLVIKDEVFVECDNYTFSPLRAATKIALNTTISITFCEDAIFPPVREGRYVTIADHSELGVPNVNVFKYIVADSMITGKTLSIEVEGLQENTTYSVIIAQGAVTDEAGNECAGINDANQWFFTTGDFTAPTVSVDAVQVDNVSGSVEITSSELGMVFLAPQMAANLTALQAAVANGTAATGIVVVAGEAVEVSTVGLPAGTYYAYAIDKAGLGAVSVNVVTVVDVVVIVIPEYTIAQIQGTGNASPYVDQVVRTTGVVTGVSATGFFMQDANAKRSGIFVYSPDLAATVGIGTGIQLTGLVNEYFGLTQLKNVVDVEYVAPVVTPKLIIIEANQMNEDYESVLVQVLNVKTSALPDEFKEWVTTKEGVNVKIDNFMYEYTPDMGRYYSITGVVNYDHDEYKLAPRYIQDIIVGVGFKNVAYSIDVYPNPFDNELNLRVSSEVAITKAVFTNIAGQLIKEVINPNNTISTSELRSGVYFISLHTVDGIAKTERIIKR